jgi:hypothetical protein
MRIRFTELGQSCNQIALENSDDRNCSVLIVSNGTER